MRIKRNPRAFYLENISNFLDQSTEKIRGIIDQNNPLVDTNILQRNTWEIEIAILKNQLIFLEGDGRILFEYVIPRMGKRIDTIILYQNIVFLLEFKCGEREYKQSALDQVVDYALDLRNFQKNSHDKLLVPILVSTNAPKKSIALSSRNRILDPICCNSDNIGDAIMRVVSEFHETPFDYYSWENSEYLPTPTIIEAAQALYRGHNVKDITRSDAGAENLTVTTDEINWIIDHSKRSNRKSICFVTGVPGAGKTLVGLNIAIERSVAKEGEHAVFLSGNYPLVRVLQEALARDKVDQSRNSDQVVKKNQALRETSAFIQIIHKYRDSFVGNNDIPPERIVIFDEAQRAWTHQQIQNFMSVKKGVLNFPYSEPEFLISTMNRLNGWAVIICLVGGGQEINTGEAGLPEWFDSLHRSFSHWDVHVTPQINDEEYTRGRDWKKFIQDLNVYEHEKLHLSTSIRSFRAEELSAFVKALLDVEYEEAKSIFSKIEKKYPIVITRELETAKNWVREMSQGTTRFGLLASSGGLRLKPDGIFVKNEIDVANWFLNGKDDVRSSYALEDVVTEFDIQGLEIDYSIVAWDADFRFYGGQWTYNRFLGSKWTKINDENRKLYLKNAYRVLLTRARQGMVIFIPYGSKTDHTRKKSFYDETYSYLRSLGIQKLS